MKTLGRLALPYWNKLP